MSYRMFYPPIKFYNFPVWKNFIILLVKTFGSAVYGIEAITITIEVNISSGKLAYFKHSIQSRRSLCLDVLLRSRQLRGAALPSAARKSGKFDNSFAVRHYAVCR